MLCPSCFTRQRIPPPQTNEKIEEAQATDQIYGLCPGRGEETKETQEMVPVYCQVCHTLMYATRERIGEYMTCPDCGTKNLICSVRQ